MGNGNGNKTWTIPNLLTIFRILLTPGFVIAFTYENFTLAWSLFAVAGLSDGLDGFLARVLRQRSKLGAVLDPLADKVLLVASFVALGWKGWLPVWLVILVVSRDLIIVGGLVLLNYLGVEGPDRLSPSRISKCNTLAQICLVLVTLIWRSTGIDLHTAVQVLVLLVAVLTIVSGAVYLRVGSQWLMEK